MQDQLTPGMEAVMRKIQGLLNLSAKNPNAEEAAAAYAKAQELLQKYNLDVATVEKESGKKDGRREQAMVEGGFYTYQRELWEAVAELNCCIHWVQDYVGIRDKTIKRTSYWGRERVYRKGDEVMKKRHVIVGRMVNTAATRAMAGYLEQTIERLIRERLTIKDGTGERVNYGQLYSSWGISFREGVAAEIMRKVSRRALENEKKAQREREAAVAAGSTGTSLAISEFRSAEHDANIDFIYGDGTSAQWAADRAERAAIRAQQQEEMARLAKEDPEEYRRQEEERRKERRRSGGGRATRERNKDWGAYHAGRSAGEKISLDQQVDRTSHRRLG